MSISIIEIYPKVFKSNTRGRVFVRASDDDGSQELKIKIQPMERYSVKHENYRVDEEDRYSYVDLLKADTGLYYTDYDFTSEQKYTAKIKVGDSYPRCMFLYSVEPDLAMLGAYKGDTHIHSCRSDGKGEPFEVGLAYRAHGFDFIAITDHQKYAPAIEAKEQFAPLTKDFVVYPGEEIHNKGMGYFHIVSFGADYSIAEAMGRRREEFDEKAMKLMEEKDLSSVPDPYNVAWRIVIADEIRKAGGIAVMAHPYWATFGEYHMQTDDVVYLWRNGHYDALEVIASCDGNCNGNNLQEALRTELALEGIRIPVVGASDAHTLTPEKADEHFNIQFTVAFAKGPDDVKDAIMNERTVAVFSRSEHDFHVVGRFRYVKYARFLLDEYFPLYTKLTAKHAEALALAKEGDRSALASAEEDIKEFKSKFFAF